MNFRGIIVRCLASGGGPVIPGSTAPSSDMSTVPFLGASGAAWRASISTAPRLRAAIVMVRTSAPGPASAAASRATRTW